MRKLNKNLLYLGRDSKNSTGGGKRQRSGQQGERKRRRVQSRQG